MNKELAVVVLAAGKGVRMKSSLPKVVHELDGMPMIQRIVNTAKNLNPVKIVTVVGYKKDIVINSIQDKDNVVFVEQKEQNGTGHAVLTTKDQFQNFSGNIIVTPGDVPLLSSQTLKYLVEFHQSKDIAATVLTTIMDDATGYGRIIRNKDGYVLKIVEHKDATPEERKVNEINTGIFCFSSNSLFDALAHVTSDNAQNEIYLTDVLEILHSQGKQVAAIETKNNFEVTGINSKSQLENLEKKLGN